MSTTYFAQTWCVNTKYIFYKLIVGLCAIVCLGFVADTRAEAIAYWSFQKNKASSSSDAASNFTLVVTSTAAGLLATPTLTMTGDIDTNYYGGEASFIDPITGETWYGSGNANQGGSAMNWKPGNSTLTLNLNTTGWENISISFDVRAAASPVADALKKFASIEYKIGAANWVTLSTVGSNFNFNVNQYEPWSLNFSSLVPELDDAGDIQIRWNFSMPNGSSRSLRIDNFVISADAVPEPGTYALLICGLGLLAALRLHRSRKA